MLRRGRIQAAPWGPAQGLPPTPRVKTPRQGLALNSPHQPTLGRPGASAELGPSLLLAHSKGRCETPSSPLGPSRPRSRVRDTDRNVEDSGRFPSAGMLGGSPATLTFRSNRRQRKAWGTQAGRGPSTLGHSAWHLSGAPASRDNLSAQTAADPREVCAAQGRLALGPLPAPPTPRILPLSAKSS